jgi:rhomboid protease GluP
MIEPDTIDPLEPESSHLDKEGAELILLLERVHHTLLSLRGVHYFPAPELDVRKPTLFTFPGRHILARDRRLLVIPWRKETMSPLLNHLARSLETVTALQPLSVLIVTLTPLAKEDADGAISVCKQGCYMFNTAGRPAALEGSGPFPKKFLEAFASAPEEVHLEPAQQAEMDSCSNIRNFFSGLEKNISRPYVSFAFLAACIAWFAFCAFQGVSLTKPGENDLVSAGAMVSELVVEGQAWRLFSANFVHIGMFHLLINMVCLHYMGPLCERLMGHVNFAVLYLFSGTFGFLLSMNNNGLILSAGASAAIFGVAGGTLGYMLGQRDRIPRPLLVHTLKGTTVFFLINLMIGLSLPIVDNAAHMGGFLAGVIISALAGRLKTLFAARPAYQLLAPLILSILCLSALAVSSRSVFTKTADQVTRALSSRVYQDVAETLNKTSVTSSTNLSPYLERNAATTQDVENRRALDWFPEKKQQLLDVLNKERALLTSLAREQQTTTPSDTASETLRKTLEPIIGP